MSEKKINQFTNQRIKKEKNRLNIGILGCIVIMAIGVALAVWGYMITKNAQDNIVPLNDILASKDENKEGKIATVNVQAKPFKFAEETDSGYGYYIIMDDKFMYIAYMSNYDELLTKEDINNNPVTIVGGTKLLSKELKEYALKAYNEGLDEEYQLTMADFDSYFGEVYLDISSTGQDVATFEYLIAGIVGIFGILGLIVVIVKRVKYSKTINNMDETMIEKVDSEMNSEDSFYYEKLHLYLTDHYVINFKGSFGVIDYQDIIWMYSTIYRTNGIKTCQTIKVMTKDGKTHQIAVLDLVTKAKKEMYDEIWNTILSKNNRIILGYTKEAAEEAQERVEN